MVDRLRCLTFMGVLPGEDSHYSDLGAWVGFHKEVRGFYDGIGDLQVVVMMVR